MSPSFSERKVGVVSEWFNLTLDVQWNKQYFIISNLNLVSEGKPLAM